MRHAMAFVGGELVLAATLVGTFDSWADRSFAAHMVQHEALMLVEWPERAGPRIPRDHVPVSLQHLPDDPTRRLLYAGGGID